MTHSRRAPSPAQGSASVQQATRVVDLERAEHAVTELLTALGYNAASAQLRDTPGRVARSLAELTAGGAPGMSVFANDAGAQGPVLIRDIAFISLCEHHLLPYQGRVHIAYLPGTRIGGFSAFASVVEMFARDLGLQETLTTQIAHYVMRELEPQALAVTVEAQHMCMAARGVQAREADIVTREVLGEHASDPAFLSFIGAPGAMDEARVAADPEA